MKGLLNSCHTLYNQFHKMLRKFPSAWGPASVILFKTCRCSNVIQVLSQKNASMANVSSVIGVITLEEAITQHNSRIKSNCVRRRAVRSRDALISQDNTKHKVVNSELYNGFITWIQLHYKNWIIWHKTQHAAQIKLQILCHKAHTANMKGWSKAPL